MKEIIYGKKPVLEWLQSHLQVRRVLIASEARRSDFSDIVKQAEKRRINIQFVNKSELDKRVKHSHHQGVLAEVFFQYAAVEDVLFAAQQKGEAPLIAVLDNVQDPHNLGAILRTADATGLHGILLPRDNAVGVTPTVVKASAGAIAHVPIAQVTNIARTMDELKEQGFWFYGTDDQATTRFDAVDFDGAAGIVMGSEGSGLRRLVKEKCDFLISIPMFGKINSLNVSVASALVFYEARRKREGKKE